MKVELVSYTDQARELLIFSKKTRITMSGKAFEEVLEMPEEQKIKELAYVFGTIGSSWEFVDYVFLITGVTRAFTHQLVRHRVGVSFAQQAQRVVDMSEFDYLETGRCVGNPVYYNAMEEIKEAYEKLIQDGVNPQDARGLLPTNVLTNILMKVNLRSLSGMLNVRLCFKAQGEFQQVAREMQRAALETHPWAAPVLQAHCCQHGNCLFPNFKECPVRPYLPSADFSNIRDVWKNTMFELQSKEDK
jgi:thymidylate synthase (FAD)